VDWSFAVIQFSLDARSGVSPYLQVVQQVRQAMRLGLIPQQDVQKRQVWEVAS
jgi:GntR family transcriptional regulator